MSVELSNTTTDLTVMAKVLDIKPPLLYRWQNATITLTSFIRGSWTHT